MEKFAVAIDGPNGAGKSSVARALAKKLGCVYVDTGALYRAIGLFVDRRGVDPDSTEQVAAVLKDASVELRYAEDGQRVYLNGEDVSALIRTPKASIYASKVSKIPAVRAALLDLQRDMAKSQSVIMDGRDIGTVILPNAEVKIFLTASAEVRANRRYLELVQKGESITPEEVLKDMVWRDRNDAERDIAPLRAAQDAVVVDTSLMSFDESVEAVERIVRERTGA